MVLQHPEVIAKIKYLPAVSIFLPVHAVITPKSQLEHRLKLIVEQREPRLATIFAEEKTASVISKLKHLIRDLNYNTRKKSIAIFALYWSSYAALLFH